MPTRHSARADLQVPRESHSLLLPETLHAGYRVAVIDDPGESPGVAGLVDGHLVQGRRHAAALAVHGWEEDAAALRGWAAGETPGIAAVTAVLAGHEAADRGTAQLVDTSRDIEHTSPLLRDACRRHGLDVIVGDGGLLGPAEVQAAYEQVAARRGQGTPGLAAQALGLSALCQGLVTALLAGEATGRCTWHLQFPVCEVLGNVAWDAFPEILPAPGRARVSSG